MCNVISVQQSRFIQTRLQFSAFILIFYEILQVNVWIFEEIMSDYPKIYARIQKIFLEEYEV